MENLFDLDFSRWGIILFSIIPAIINIGIFLYVSVFLSRSKTNNAFSIFVMMVGLWQATDGLMRMSITAKTAFEWNIVSNVFELFVFPFGILFILYFSKWYKKISNNLVFLIPFLPATIFLFLVTTRLDKYSIVKSDYWYWIADPEPIIVNYILYAWFATGALLMLILLWVYNRKVKKDEIKRKQSLLLAIGFSIPVLVGIIVETVFPLIEKLDDIPLTTPLFTIFSVASLIAIKKYKLLDYSPRHQWDQIVEVMSEGLLIVNNQDEIMYANKMFCELSGYKFEEIKEKTTYELFYNDSITKKQVENFIEDKKNNRSGEYEVQLKTKSGERLWMIMSNSPYVGKNGKTIGSISIQTNINERKKAEERLVHNELRLKEAQAIAHIGSWEVNFSTGVALWSDETCSIYGIPVEENKQTFNSWLSFIHPEDLDYVMKMITESESSLSGTSFYHRIIRKDGTVRYILAKSEFDFNNEGKPTGLYGIAHDVTEQKQAEQKKEFEKNNLSSLINNTNDLMWSIGKDMKLITSNNAFDEIVMFMSGQSIKQGSEIPTEGFNEERLARWCKFYERAFSGETFSITEYSDSPVEIWSEISFYPIREGNEIVGTACYSRNITERKRAEAEIKKLNEGLEDRVKKRTSELARANVLLENETKMVVSASKIIEQKNKDITDSLNYAKLIQNSIIHKKETLEKLLPQSFILNMPLNIVSGDFVRVDEKKGKILTALADCTGHGIPGAMMSMVGCALFNEIVNYKKKIDPSTVLGLLDSSFKELTKEAASINDGMDVGFCSIDLNIMELNYAGAHRPLFMIRNNILTEIKGDNLSIGCGDADDEKKFTNHSLGLCKNDTIYMFSDGYTDQFGGADGKKFSTKRFKELLVSIQHLSMEEQENYLKKAIIEWKGDVAQIDDICVLGIRI